MLTSALLGAGTGLVKFGMDKVARSMEEEAKVKAEAEREARIEEAAIRSEARASTREDLKYNKIRTDTLADKETQYAQDYINKATEHEYRVEDFNTQERLRQQDDIAKEKREAIRRNDPTDIDYKFKNQQLETSKAAELNSNTLKTTQEINQKVAQMELDRKTQILDLQNKIQTTTDENEANKLKSKLIWLEGKSDEPSIQKMTIDTGRIDPSTRKPIEEDILVKVDKITGKWETLDVAGRLKEGKPFTKEEAIAVAKAEADADPKIGVRNSTWFDTKGDKDNTSQYDDYINKRVVELTNTPRGMLNSKSEGKTSDKAIEQTVKTSDKAIEQTVKTATANPLIKFTDDPVKQGQFDTITGVLLYSESGLKGANVGRPKATKDNPHPTADGSYQLTNIAMKDLNIKPDLPNGEYSVEAKEKAAPDLYKKAYTATQGDASAFLAYRFSPPDIKQAVEKAKKEGGNWWDYAKSDLTKANMPTVIRDAERTMMQLARENKRVPLEISKIILANK